MTDDKVTLASGDEWTLGCVFDGAMGWHNIYRVVDLAEEVSKFAKDGGYRVSDSDRPHLDAYRNGEEIDENTGQFVCEMADEADTYLNSLCPEGYEFAWDDGYYLWRVEEDETAP